MTTNVQVVSINNTSVSVINYKNLPVVTTAMLADFYGTDTDNIKQNHSRNKGRFVEGKHYFKLEGEELRQFKKTLGGSKLLSANTRHFILWTERGAARHAKILNTDQAWDIFEKLEDNYFCKNTNTEPHLPLSPQANDILRVIHKHGESGLTLREIIRSSRRFSAMPDQQRHYFLRELITSNAVRYAEIPSPSGRGKSRCVYIALRAPDVNSIHYSADQNQFFLTRSMAHEFDTRVNFLFDLAGLLAKRGDDIAGLFQKQAKELNKFLVWQEQHRVES